MIVDELIAVLGYDLDGEGDRRRFEAGLASLRSNIRGLATVAAAAGAVIGTAVAAGVGLAGRSVVQTSAQFETFEATLTTIEGSAEAARASLDWIAEFGKRTPYDVEQVTAAFVKLKAYGIDPIADDTLQVLGDTASSMGKTLTDAVEMFADASTGEFERLKEFGMRASQQGDQVTFSWTKNGEQLTETVEKNGEAIRRFLIDTLGDRFTGAMDRQSRTFTGLVSNLGDTWTDFQRRIGEAGFFDVVKGQLESILGWATRMDQNGSLDRWARQFSDALTWAAETAQAAGEHIMQQFSTLLQLFENPTLRAAAAALGIALAAAFAWAFPVITTMIALGLAIDDLISYIGGGESVIGDFIEWMKRLGASIGGAFDVESFRQIGDNLAEMIFDGFKWAVARLFVNMTWMLRFIWSGLTGSSAESGAADAAGKIAKWFFDSLRAAWHTFEGLVNGLIAETVEWFTSTDWGAVGRSIAIGILNGLKSIGGQITAWFAGLVPDWARGLIGGGATQRGGNSHVESGYSESAARASSLMGPGSVRSTVTDQSNRSSTTHNNITVNQTVTQATDAPMAAATGASRAVGNAVGPAARVQSEGAR